MTTQTVSLLDLRQARCERCPPGVECEDQIALLPRCHPRAGARVIFNKATERLEFSCMKCERPIAEVVLSAFIGAS